MSVLGRGEILRRIGEGDLSVTPILSDGQIGASSVDLRMGNVVLMVRARGMATVDPLAAKRAAERKPHEGEHDYQQKHERYELPFGSPFLLHPGSLALVPTLEWVSIPGDLMGEVTARSTWAREGLSIATATLIEPRYEGIVTLELANLGQVPLTLYPGLELAQISFTEVKGDTRPSRRKKSQFRLSFEPRQGDVVKRTDFPLLPD